MTTKRQRFDIACFINGDADILRISHDGTLKDYDETASLSSTYPLGAPILYDLLGIPDAKTTKHPFFLNHDASATSARTIRRPVRGSRGGSRGRRITTSGAGPRDTG